MEEARGSVMEAMVDLLGSEVVGDLLSFRRPRSQLMEGTRHMSRDDEHPPDRGALELGLQAFDLTRSEIGSPRGRRVRHRTHHPWRASVEEVPAGLETGQLWRLENRI